jgi:hypothetical protein
VGGISGVHHEKVQIVNGGRTAAFALAAIMAVGIVTGCSKGPTGNVPSAGGLPSGASVATAAAPQLRNAEVLSRTYRLTPSGPLTRPQTIRLPLTRRVPPGWAVVVATAETSQGPWTYLQASLSADRRTAIFSTDHHSIFTVIGEDVDSLLAFFKTQFLDGLSSGATATAAKPACAGESAARSGYAVNSTDGPTVYWCFGIDSSGQRILRIVNNRLYPLEIQASRARGGRTTGY